MAQCSTCGSIVPETSSLCPDCGMELRPPNVPMSEASAKPAQATSSPGPVAPSASQMDETRRPATQENSARARLTLRRGGALSQDVHSLGEGPSVLGRFDPETGPVDVDLGPLPEAVYVSRHHAEIWRDASGEWLVKDLGSGNGTFVCAAGQRQFRKVSGDTPIKDGDELALGNARFEFRIS